MIDISKFVNQFCKQSFWNIGSPFNALFYLLLLFNVCQKNVQEGIEFCCLYFERLHTSKKGKSSVNVNMLCIKCLS